MSTILSSFRKSYARQTVLLWLALSAATVVIVRGIGKGEFSINVDESFHACTGLFVASFLHDLPLRHPVAYTYLYYAHYPALQLIGYPPVFYTVEGLGFLILGPSVVAARVTVLLFGLFGLYFWFRLVAELQDEITAAISTVLLAFLPSVLLYEKAAMLEIPALALSLASSYYWIRYLREGAPRLVYYFAIFAALALLTKSQTAYLAAWCMLSVIVTGRWRAVLNRQTALALLLSVALALPFFALSLTFAAPLVRANALQGGHRIAHPLLFYFEQLPSQIGWGILALAVVGILTIRLWERPRNAAIMLTWVLACYVTQTAIANKEARYIIYWIPPLVYLAVAPLTTLFRNPRLMARIPAAAAILALVGSYSTIAWCYRRPYVSGYAEMARHLVSEPGGYVLTDTPLDGDLIFFARAFDPAGRFIINRKALYVVNQVKQYGYIEFAHSTDEVRNVIRNNGFRYIIVNTDVKPTFESQRFLRQVLQGPEFKCLYRVPVESNTPGYAGDTLVLYEYARSRPPTTGTYSIKVLTLNRDISVPRSALDVDIRRSENRVSSGPALPMACLSPLQGHRKGMEPAPGKQ